MRLIITFTNRGRSSQREAGAASVRHASRRLVTLLGAPQRLRRRRRERFSKERDQLAALGGRQALKDVAFDLLRQLARPFQGPPPLWRNQDLAGAAILRVRPPLGQPG